MREYSITKLQDAKDVEIWEDSLRNVPRLAAVNGSPHFI
jgi:hypothetical protein